MVAAPSTYSSNSTVPQDDNAVETTKPSESFDPTNLSSIYFGASSASTPQQPPYVGPVTVVATETPRGRGLFATQDIATGDLLMIVPAMASADVDTTFRIFQELEGNEPPEDRNTVINVAAERALVDTILEEQCTKPGLLQSLKVLEGSGCDVEETPDKAESFLQILLGNGGATDDTTTTSFDVDDYLTEEQVQQIIRRNAFGPEFCTFSRIQHKWRNNDTTYFRPPHLLGLYPLAAMINHSCIPNAIRVFVSGVMVVHACQPIPAGTEIVWSYVPLTDHCVRQRHLCALDFVCDDCDRCRAEAHMAPPTSDSTVADLEERILPALPCNEWRRYMRVGSLRVYLDAMNSSQSNASMEELSQKWLPICTQLHLALASCHNASTEHLSVRGVLCWEWKDIVSLAHNPFPTHSSYSVYRFSTGATNSPLRPNASFGFSSCARPF